MAKTDNSELCCHARCGDLRSERLAIWPEPSHNNRMGQVSSNWSGYQRISVWKGSDARWLCGNWPLRNRAQETCFRQSENPPKAVETNDESNYEGPPTTCRRNFTSGSHVPSLAKSYSFHYQTVMALIPHQKLKGRFAWQRMDSRRHGWKQPFIASSKTSVITLSRLQTCTAADLLLEEHGTAVSVCCEE